MTTAVSPARYSATDERASGRDCAGELHHQPGHNLTTPEDLADLISAGPDVELHLAAIKKHVDAGFDHIVLVGIGPDQERFIQFFEKELRPRLNEFG